MTPAQFTKCRALADKLIASCDGGRDYQDEVEALTQEECKMLDSMALECCTCNQWFAASEMIDTGSQWECSDCHG